MKCKVSKATIKPFMTFGKMPMANGFLKKKDFKREFFYKLEVGFNKKNFLFQVNDHPKPPKIFNNYYPFFTNKSKFMVNHFKNYFKWLKKQKKLNHKSICIEIGSNDGTFLKNFKSSKINCLGIEPSKNVADYAKKRKLNVLNKFFCFKEMTKLKKYHYQTDLICAANVICHIPNLNDVIKSIDLLLKEDGIFVFEEPYLGSMFEKVSYDQIYDAHIYMFSAHSVQKIFDEKGFELINIEPQKTHGGSMRYTIARKNKFEINKKVFKILSLERKNKLDKIESCLKFKKNCFLSRDKFRDKVIGLKKRGLKIAGYAASAKSTTALNFCNINNQYLDYIADNTDEKIKKFTPGTHIPIVSIEFFRKNYPDVMVLCSWNHKKEILKKEKKFLKSGGQWISHVKKI
jgi:methylation protein EvaC